jgi:hypothetical protein
MTAVANLSGFRSTFADSNRINAFLRSGRVRRLVPDHCARSDVRADGPWCRACRFRERLTAG